MGYDRHQFVENIESIQGIKHLRDETYDGISVRVYENGLGNVVVMEVTDLDEDVLEGEGTGILILLGLAHLVPLFFPKEHDQPEPLEAEINIENVDEHV